MVGFLLLQYSVVYAVESLSWFHLLFISQFVLSSGCCIDGLGISHANQTYICLGSLQK